MGETKKTDIKKERFKTKKAKEMIISNYIRTTGNISMLCKMVGIGRATFYRWMEKDKRFREAIEAESEGLIDFVENKLFALINEKNPAAIFFFLKTRAKHRGYVEQWEHKHDMTVKYELSERFVPEIIKKEDEGDKSK